MEWKTIIGNKHEVSRDGRVRNKKTKRELKADMSGGYKRVLIVVDGVRTHQAIHRLVATAFCENKNPQEFIYVNHIDENKLNNNVSNLEMCSNKYNCRYGSRRTKLAKPVIQETLEGKFVKEWISIREITRTLGYARACISACCKGVLKSSHTGKIYPVRHAYGYKWRYKI